MKFFGRLIAVIFLIAFAKPVYATPECDALGSVELSKRGGGAVQCEQNMALIAKIKQELAVDTQQEPLELKGIVQSLDLTDLKRMFAQMHENYDYLLKLHHALDKGAGILKLRSGGVTGTALDIKKLKSYLKSINGARLSAKDNGNKRKAFQNVDTLMVKELGPISDSIARRRAAISEPLQQILHTRAQLDALTNEYNKELNRLYSAAVQNQQDLRRITSDEQRVVTVFEADRTPSSGRQALPGGSSYVSPMRRQQPRASGPFR